MADLQEIFAPSSNVRIARTVRESEGQRRTRGGAPDDDGVVRSPSVRAVLLKQDGGSSGADGSGCTYTYSCYSLRDETLANPLKINVGFENNFRRLPVQMTAAPDGSRGTVMIDGDGWYLSYAPEKEAYGCDGDTSGSEDA